MKRDIEMKLACGDRAMKEVLNGLALCAGIGGIELGLKLMLGDSYRTVCYVEREIYCAEVLATRMAEGYLDMAPVWDDVATFDGKPWRGKVDIVTSGFPCQPFSAAGKQLKEADERHIWPDIARIIGECKPGFVFLENVAISAFREPFADLRAMGYEVSTPYACTAAELGAGHLRRRVFVLGYAHYQRRIQQTRAECTEWGWSEDSTPSNAEECSGWSGVSSSQRNPAGTEITGADWWASEPGLERLVHGVPYRVERDRALGNAVVPVVAAKAFTKLVQTAKRLAQ